MADEVLIAQFRAELSGVKKQLDEYVASLEKVKQKEEDLEKQQNETADSARDASKKRSALLKQELAELKRLETSQKKAFTPVAIENFNRKIEESKRRISQLTGTTQSVGAQIKTSLAGVGAGFLAAFSIQGVLNSLKAASNAFLEAEENANRLKFAVTQIGNESEVAFDRLIKQSAELQNISIFSDDSIQQAQTALATFGLAADQIEALTPKILDFASATKTDLTSATDTFLRALEGQSRGLVTAGLKFEDTGTIIGNYNVLLESTSKLTGATEEATKTLTGQLKQMENQADELQESIGSRLAESFTVWRFAALKLFETILQGFEGLEGQRARALKNTRDLIQANIEANIQGNAALNNLTVEEQAQKQLIETGRRLIEIKKEIQANPALFPRLSKEREELTQVAGVLSDIIKLEQSKKQTDVELIPIDKLRSANLEQLNALLKKNAEGQDITSKSNVQNITKEIEARKKQTEELEKELAKQLQKFKDLNSGASKIPPIELKVNFEEPKIEVPFDDQKQVVLKPVDATQFNDSIEAVEAKTLKGWLETNSKMLDASQQLVSELLNLFDQLANNQIAKIEKQTEKELEALDARSKANDADLKKRAVSEKEFADIQRDIEADKVRTEEAADKKIREIKRKQFIADKVAALAEIVISTAKNVVEFPQLAAFYLAIGAAQGAIVAAQPVPYKKGTKSAKGGLSRVDEEGPEAIVSSGPGRVTTLQRGDKVVPFRQSKKYEKVFDAMVENRFEDFVFKNFVTPELHKQKKQFIEQKEKRFAETISNSIINHNSTSTTVKQMQQPTRSDFWLERIAKGGVNVKNLDQFGEAMYQRNRQSPKR